MSRGSLLAAWALLVACGGDSPAATSTALFQPGFHQALRASVDTGGSTVTLRYRVPTARGGARVRVTLRAGDGALRIDGARLARSTGLRGETADAVPLLFDGATGATLAPRQRRTGDPVAFAVAAGDSLAVSFVATGALSASIIADFPGSFARAGAGLDDADATGAAWTANPRIAGLATVEVEGPREPVAVAVGDSITEGYVGGQLFDGTSLADSAGYAAYDDYRAAWSAVGGAARGHAIVNAAASGQGTADELAHVADEVLVLAGEIDDCVVLLGTNDLSGTGDGLGPDEITANLARLGGLLAPVCRVRVGTLVPKEWDPAGGLTEVQWDVVRDGRHAVNAWIRGLGPQDGVAGIVDFEAVTRASATDVDHFGVDASGASLGEDGIHPSVAGQRAMGLEAARVLR